MDKCCRNCHYFEFGKCHNSNVGGTDIEDLFTDFIEEGTLSSVIEESFKSESFNLLKDSLLNTNLSKKKVEEILSIFYSELEGKKTHWVESIDEDVSVAMYDLCDKVNLVPHNPSSFYCKEWS